MELSSTSTFVASESSSQHLQTFLRMVGTLLQDVSTFIILPKLIQIQAPGPCPALDQSEFASESIALSHAQPPLCTLKLREPMHLGQSCACLVNIVCFRH